jgi:hypothetical protein
MAYDVKIAYLMALIVALALVFPPPAAGQQADSTGAEKAHRFERADPHSYRLLLAPTARPLGAGEVAASLTNVFLPQVAIGVTEAITIEGGMLALPPQFGDLFVFTPSVRLLERGHLDVAVSAQAVAIKEPDVNESDVFFIGWTGGILQAGGVPLFGAEQRWRYAIAPRGVVTYGTEAASLTAAAGVPIANQRHDEMVSNIRSPVLSVGGHLQLLNWLALVTENDLALGVPVQTPFSRRAPRTSSQDVVNEEGETKAFQTTSGARLFWDHFAIDLAAGVLTYGRSEFDREIQAVLRFSYRF